METSFRLHRPSSLLGWVVYPFRWTAWRLNKPLYDQVAHALAARADQLDHLARDARTHAESVHAPVIDLQRSADRLNARLDELQNLAEYTRTHADNILGLVFDTHKRLDAIQEHADNVLGVARQAERQANAARQQVEAEAAMRASLVPPLAISPLMAQAITIDHVALTRRLAMLENWLVELQAAVGSETAAVLPMAAPRRLAS